MLNWLQWKWWKLTDTTPSFIYSLFWICFWPRCSSERSYNPLWWICSCDFSPKLALNSWELEFYIRKTKEAYGKDRGHSSFCHWGFLEATLRPFRGHLETDLQLEIYIRTTKEAYGKHRGHSSLCHWGFLEASLRPFRGHLEAI